MALNNWKGVLLTPPGKKNCFKHSRQVIKRIKFKTATNSAKKWTFLAASPAAKQRVGDKKRADNTNNAFIFISKNDVNLLN